MTWEFSGDSTWKIPMENPMWMEIYRMENGGLIGWKMVIMVSFKHLMISHCHGAGYQQDRIHTSG